MAEVGLGQPAPVFKQNVAASGWADQRERQIRQARVVQHHAHRRRREQFVVRDLDGRIADRVVQNRRLVRGGEDERRNIRQVPRQAGLIAQVLRHGVRVGDAEEEREARLQRRQIGQAHREAAAAGGNRLGVVKGGGGRQRAVAHVELDRQRVAGDADLHAGAVEGHGNEIILQPVRGDGDAVRQHNPVGAARRQVILHMRIQVDGQTIYATGMGQSVVHHDQRPLAVDAVADELSQASRAVGFSKTKNRVGSGVLIDGLLRDVAVAESVVVQHGRLGPVVSQGAEQVAEIFMGDDVRDGDAAHLHVGCRHRIRRDRNRPGQRRAAIGNDGRRGKSREGVVAVVEWKQAEQRRQRVLRRQMILGLDADVINLVRQRVAQDDLLKAAAAQRFAGQIHRVGLQRQQIRIQAHIQIYVRLEPRGLVGEHRVRHSHPRRREINRQRRGEQRVGEGRRVRDDVEMPLVRLAQRDQPVRGDQRHDVRADHGRVGSDPLFAQHLAEDVGIGRAKLVRHHRGVREVGRDTARILHQRQPRGQLPVPAGDHQRVILHDAVGVRGDRVDVDGTPDDGDRVVRAQRGREENIFHVVDEVEIGQAVRVPLGVEVCARLDVVAEIDQRVGRVVEVRDHQVQIVHQLDAGGRVAGRIGPDQRHAHWLVLRGVGHLHHDRVAVPGGQRVGRMLVKH